MYAKQAKDQSSVKALTLAILKDAQFLDENRQTFFCYSNKSTAAAAAPTITNKAMTRPAVSIFITLRSM